MSKIVVKHWPLFASVVILFVTTGMISTIIILRENGHLVFALDDPYIQMAMAKNFALHGVWGITRFGFTSASSSPLWTFLIALTYMVFGVSETAPFYLSLISSALMLGAAYAVLRWYRLSPTFIFWTLVVLIFFTPLPTLICIGSEHPLHAALTILLTFLAARLLSEESPDTARRDMILLLAISPFLTAVRYEGLFLIFVIGVLFLLRGRWLEGLAVAAAGFSSVLFYGAIDMAHGWSWLPSSILLKGSFPRFTSFGTAVDSIFGPAYTNFKQGPHVVVLIAASLFLALFAADKRQALWDSRRVMTAIFVLLALAHLQFCMVALFFRHESYLVALGIIVTVVQLPDLLPEKPFRKPFDLSLVPKYVGSFLLAGVVIYPCAVRAGAALVYLAQASKNIYEQQYQMASFVEKYYQGSTIALNDIGAVNFLADVHCLDLWGLGDYTVTRLRQRHEYHTRDILRLSRQAGIKLAIVYDSWYAGEIGGLPREWVWVGQWALTDNVVAGGDTVSIYAVDESETLPLMQKLQDFSPFLPKGVKQSGRYLYGMAAASDK